MNLSDYYNSLYKNSVEKIKKGILEVDPLIDSSADNRFGITLLARPPLQVKERIQQFLQELRNIDNQQYYYPDSDIHITIMSVISCYEGFMLKNIHLPDYIDIIEKSIQDIQSFPVQFKGITASPSCVMIQGFLQTEMLNSLRNNLRTNFRNSHLEQSIDKRYAVHTAHATVVRFRKDLSNTPEFIKVLENYRHYNFGTFQVTNPELVLNDWYQREEHVQKLHSFKLK